MGFILRASRGEMNEESTVHRIPSGKRYGQEASPGLSRAPCKSTNPVLLRVWPVNPSISTTWSLLDMKNLRSTSDLLNQNPHFINIPR